MPPRDAKGPPRRGNSFGVLASGVRHVNKKPGRRPARITPARSPVFGPLGRQTTPVTQLHQRQRQTKQIQRKLPRAPQRNPSLPPPKPRPGTPFGAFRANEPVAPILRARTQARVQTARGYGYHGPTPRLAQIGAQIQKSSVDAIPNRPKQGKGLGGFLATATPAVALTNVATGLVHGHLPSLGTLASTAPGIGIFNRALADTAATTVTHPGPVLGHTATGLGAIIAGTPAGIAELATGTVSSHPLAPWKRLAAATASDVSRRYGPLVTGNDAEFRRRIQAEGIAPELLDATMVLGGGAAAGGRVAGRVAREGRLGAGLRRTATRRPALRLSGDLAVEQDVHPNLLRALGQRGQDVARERRHAGKVRRAQTNDAPGPGLTPRAGEVVPYSQRLAARRQRVLISRKGAQSYLANRHEQHRELAQGTERDLAHLSPKQRRAVYHAMQGLVPLNGDVGAVRHWLSVRKQQILAERGRVGTKEQPAHVAKHTELAAIDFLDEHADDIFGRALAGFHEANLERSKRLAEGDPALQSSTAEVRRHRPQGEMLGVEYRYETARDAIHEAHPPGPERDAALAALDAHKPDMDAEFIAETQRRAEAAGLPEPAYFEHAKRPTGRPSVRTAGNVARAVRGNHRTELKLFREGRAVADPSIFVQGLAQNIKRKHQWNAVADVAKEHTFPWSRGKTNTGMRLEHLRDEIDSRGLDLNDFEFYNPGRFRSYVERAGGENIANLKNAIKDAVVKPEQIRVGDADLLRTGGFFAVPKGVGDELKAMLTPGGKPTRVFGRLQGFQSAAILGLNPSWLQMQVAANTFQAGLGMRGNFKDLLAGQAWYRSLPDDARRHVDQLANAGVFEGHTTTPHLGHYQGRVAKAAERLGQVPLARVGGKAFRVTDANPIRWMFKGDSVQNHVFRVGVLYNAAKRKAFRDMQRDLGQAQASQARVSQLLKLKPGEELDAQVRRILNNPRDVEKLGEHVDRVLGDYLRYTSRERRYFRPYVIFYGFLRYALKTLLYTLPVHHPLAAAITAKVGQLHDEEIRHLFGTRDVPPWVFSRMFLYDGTKVRRDKQGRPLSIDLARINPVTTPVTEVLQESASRRNKKGEVTSGFNPGPVIGMFSPMVQVLADQAYSKNSFESRDFRVHGNAETNPAPDLGSRARIVTNKLLSSAFPYREAVKLSQPGTLGDDTLLFSPRPIKYRTPGTIAEEQQRRARLPPTAQRLQQDLAPFVFPRGDTTPDYLKTHPGPSSAPSKPDPDRARLIREARAAAPHVSQSEREALIREALAARGR